MQALKRIQKNVTYLVEPLFLVGAFFLMQLPLRDFDIWFHMKAGEFFVQNGLRFADPFSFTAHGREWIAFEWLFGIISYELSRIGLWIVPPFIALIVVIFIFVYLRTLRDVFNVPLWIRVTNAFLFLTLTYEFFTARPLVPAYTCILITMSLCLYRMMKGKKWIYLLPILTLFWTNIHSTGFLSWGMTLTFGLIALTMETIERGRVTPEEGIPAVREKGWTRYLYIAKQCLFTGAARDLLLVSFLCAIVTILPPKGFLDYKLLWTFFTNRQFLAQFVAEWAPPGADAQIGFYVYVGLFIVGAAMTAAVALIQKKILPYLWTIPFLILSIMGFTATRNVLLGTMGDCFLLAWSTPILWKHIRIPLKQHVGGALLILLVGICGYFLSLKWNYIRTQRLYYPVQATQFAKRYLHGNMFNEYSYGGYILYATYPQLNVFIDGRAEVYLCCEMHDYLSLAENKYLSDSQYREFLKAFFDKYSIDFVMISVEKHDVMRRIANLLSTDPTWSLVFWDDDDQVFVKRNGKNDDIIKQLDTKSATPYLREPFIKDETERALFEYQRMDDIAPSAHTSNAIGYISMLNGQYDEAKKRFQEAQNLDPTFESPYMNLGELAVKDGNVMEAVRYYHIAMRLASDRGLTYIRLGQLMQQAHLPVSEIRKLWQDGVKNTVDTDAKKQLQQLLTSLSPTP